MIDNNIQAIVLAAGKSSRLKTGKNKLAQKICGQEMVLYSTKLLEQLKIPTTVIVGYQREVVQEIITKQHGDTIAYVIQEALRGTGHAVMESKEHWTYDHILVINGDMPLICESIVQDLYTQHIKTDATASFVIAHNPDPHTAYGRVIQNGAKIEIIEAKDFKGDINQACCINAGIYLFKRQFLQQNINKLKDNNASNELYLTDLIKIASDQNCIVATTVAHFDLVRGVNTFEELWAVEQIKKSELIKKFMHEGVRFICPQTTIVDVDVHIGPGTVIGAGVHVLNKTVIGKNCIIEPFSILDATAISDASVIPAYTVIKDRYTRQDTIRAFQETGA